MHLLPYWSALPRTGPSVFQQHSNPSESILLATTFTIDFGVGMSDLEPYTLNPLNPKP